MIINIAGTSGSGKSHTMRSFLDWARPRGTVSANHIDGRKAPLGYYVTVEDKEYKIDRDIYVLGSYKTPTGGCDTVPKVEAVFDLVRQKYVEEGCHVLYEGLFVMNHTRGPQMAAEFGEELAIIQLTTPYATCVASINDRRSERGEGKLLDKSNTKGNFVRASNYCDKMRAQGALVIKSTREQALDKILGLLFGEK